jgi:hypothetical protein
VDGLSGVPEYVSRLIETTANKDKAILSEVLKVGMVLGLNGLEWSTEEFGLGITDAEELLWRVQHTPISCNPSVGVIVEEGKLAVYRKSDVWFWMVKSRINPS